MDATQFSNELIALEGSLLRFAHSLTSCNEEAHDLLQETYLRALTFKDSFRENTNMKAWAFTIMRNTFINNYRRLARKNTTFDETDDQRILNNRIGEATADGNLSYQEVLEAMEGLNEDFRLPLQMHTHGYKYREIADELNLCIGTVKSRIFFSRQKLMAQLPGYVE